MPVRRHPVAVSNASERLSGVPLDRALIARLKASYELVRAHDLRLAEIFYEKLFAAAPAVRPLFRSEPEVQSRKLIASLDAIVRNLEAPAENAQMLADLGRRHAGYGARPEHYDLVIELLVDSMCKVLGAHAEAHTLDEWRLALRLVSDQMIAAAAAGERPGAG